MSAEQSTDGRGGEVPAPADQPPADQPPADQPPADQPPADPAAAGRPTWRARFRRARAKAGPTTTDAGEAASDRASGGDGPASAAPPPGRPAEAGVAEEPRTGEPRTGEPRTGEPRTGEPGADKAVETAGAGGKDPVTTAHPDPWARFAPVPERTPGRLRRALAAVGRAFVHEWTLVAVASALLAVAMTWPTLRYPQYTIPQDVWDPTLQAWQMAWSGHILTLDVAQLWHGNAFYPDRYSFAFSDTLLGYAPAGMIGEGPEAAVLRYNIMFVLAQALAFIGAYALVRQLGAGRTAAGVVGVVFAYAPWRLAQAGHLHVLSSGGIALALALLARGHGWSLRHGYRPAHRHAGWAFAGWLVATWQITLGFGIGLPFAYILGVIAVVVFVMWWVRRLWRGRRPFGVRLLLADLFGGLAFAVVGVLLALPYFKVADLHPYAMRSLDELRMYSVPLNGFLIAPEESWIWGGLHADARDGLRWPPETAVLPGFVLFALAFAGLFLSIWRVHHRVLLLAGVLLTGVLAMGTRFFGGHAGYLLLFTYLPGWQGVRTPGRFVLWMTLLLGILAAGAVAGFIQRAHETRREPAVANRLGFWLRLATLLPLLLVLVEGLNRTPHPVVPLQPEAMRTAQSPILVLPSNNRIDNNVMLWSTDRFEPIVNGNSGFITRRLAGAREVTAAFPDPNSIDYLRELGVRTVILLPGRAVGTPWERAASIPVDGLGITREEVGEAVVYRLN
jgi:hypothetical protein